MSSAVTASSLSSACRMSGAHAVRIAAACAFFGERNERILWCRKALPRLSSGYSVSSQFIERETAAVEKADGLIDGFRPISKEPRHLLRRFQVPLGIGFKAAAGGFDRHMLADAGDDVLQRTAFGRVIEHIIDGDQRDRSIASDRQQAAPVGGRRRRDRACWRQARRSDVTPLASRRASRAPSLSALIRCGGMTMRLRPSMCSSRSSMKENAFAFFGAAFADRQAGA